MTPKIKTAINNCEKAEKAWRAAHAALTGKISTNGYGIHNDPFELRIKLIEAQQQIKLALEALNNIKWPTEQDYENE